MRRVLVAAAVLVVMACGSAPSAGSPLTVDELKFTVIDAVGAPVFCDRDFYPLARAGGEEASAAVAYPKIRANSEQYVAIVAHEHLPALPAELNDAEKLALYRAYKELEALSLTSAASGYSFSYTTSANTTYARVSGNVSSDGTVGGLSKTPGGRPNCPICLAATTMIATPGGEVVVTGLTVGMIVWTQAGDGRRVAAPIVEVGSTPVPPTHKMVHLRLADGRELWASPGHRTADGRQLGTLTVGARVDGSVVRTWELVSYAAGRTYDLLPAGPTGSYWANGILVSSTLTPGG